MKELVEEFARLEQEVALARINITKFVNGAKGAKSASVKARKNLLNIKNSAHAMRNMISRIKNEGTYKTEE